MQGKELAPCNRFIRLSVLCDSGRSLVTWKPWALQWSASWWSFAARIQRRSVVPFFNHHARKDKWLVVGSSRHWWLFTEMVKYGDGKNYNSCWENFKVCVKEPQLLWSLLGRTLAQRARFVDGGRWIWARSPMRLLEDGGDLSFKNACEYMYWKSCPLSA